MESLVDRSSLKTLVEKHWRTIIVLLDADQNAAVAEIFAFEDYIFRSAENYSPAEADEFLSTVAEFRKELADRARNDHVALRRELGLNLVGDQNSMIILVNLETATTLDPKMYLHEFWRKAIVLPKREKQKIELFWNELCASLQQKLSGFPQHEQDAFFTRIAVLNETYIKNYPINPSAIRKIVGLPDEESKSQNKSLADTVVKTAVDASIGQVFSAIFGLFKK